MICESDSNAFRQVVHEAMQSAKYKMLSRRSDGLLWAAYKRIAGPVVLSLNNAIFFQVVLRLEVGAVAAHALIWQGEDGQVPEVERSGRDLYRIATDLHKVIMLVVNFLLYATLWVVHRHCQRLVLLVMILGVMWIGVRLMQMFTMIVGVSFSPHYSSTGYARPAFNTLAHYVEIAGLFASLYLVLACADGEAFNKVNGEPVLLTQFFNAYYFSHMTIATVSFGDIVPVTVLSRAAVTAEILMGMFILIVILQRAFAAVKPQDAC